MVNYRLLSIKWTNWPKLHFTNLLFWYSPEIIHICGCKQYLCHFGITVWQVIWIRWQSGGFLPGGPGFESRSGSYEMVFKYNPYWWLYRDNKSYISVTQTTFISTLILQCRNVGWYHVCMMCTLLWYLQQNLSLKRTQNLITWDLNLRPSERWADALTSMPSRYPLFANKCLWLSECQKD